MFSQPQFLTQLLQTLSAKRVQPTANFSIRSRKSTLSLITHYSLLITYYSLFQSPVSAQIIPDNTLGSENSIVTPGQLRDLIEGGAIRGDNLFHSFSEFNVNDGQQVYFVNPDSILNIFTRVTGVNPSDIFGTLGVDGGANLVLINPNGIHFGENATLDVSGSFFVTTAESVVFGNQGEFSAKQPEAPPLLTVNITPGLQYGDNPPAELINEGQISVGGKLVFSGSSITSTGSLTGSEVVVEAVDGDAQVQDVTAQTATLKAEENLLLHSSQLQTTGDLNLLAEDTVIIRDSVSKPFLAQTGGNLHIQGNQAIDILALNHPQTPFQSLGNLTLASDGNISTDAHFFSGGNLSFVNLAGQPGTVVSLYDPIISADGDVSFGNYTGAALKVEATGEINVTGDVTITTPDVLLNGTAPNDPDVDILTTEPAFILRAGLDSLENTPSALPTNAGSSTFTGSNPATTPGGITVNGNVSTGNLLGDGGAIIFSAEGNITVNGNLNTTSSMGDSGDISLTTNGEISLNNAQITTDTFFANGNAGSITIGAIGQVTVDNSSISSNVNPPATGDGGDISINADSATITNSDLATSTALLSDSATIDISVNNQLSINNSSIVNAVPELIPGNAGAISLDAANINISNNSTINSDADSGAAGFIDIRADNSITITDSIVTAEGFGFDNFDVFGDTGAIDIITDTGTITVTRSDLSTSSLGTGIAGNIYISAGGDVSAADSFIQSNSDAGIAGFIDVIAGQNVSIADSFLTAESAGFDFLNLDSFGTGGALDITSINGSIELNNSILSTTADGAGFAGSVFLFSGNDLDILDSEIESSATDGIAGIINLTATNSLNFNNSEINAQTEGLTDTDTSDFVGEIEFEAASISLRNSQIDASTSGTSNAGNIELIATNNGSISVDASNLESLARLGSEGNAGNINVTAGELTATTNSVISSSTEGIGDAGIVTLDVANISLNNSNINTIAVDDSTGNSGNVEINTSSLTLTQGARIQAQTSGTGNAGNISITATDSISVSGTSPFGLNSGLITSSQNEDSGLGGDIIINSSDNPQGTLTISDRGFLSAQTRSGNDGGFIEINVNNLNVQTGGQIITTAAVDSAGKAGDILINATDSVNISGVGVEFVQNNDNSDDPTANTPFENVTVYNLNDLTFITEENANVQNSGTNGTPYVSISRTATEITSSDGTVLGAADNTVDYYSFGITTADSEGVFDIDNSSNIDTQLFLFNLNTGEFLSSSDDSDITEGAEGSNSIFDSFLEYEFITSGNFVIGVGEFPSSASNGTIVSGEAPDVGDLYTLQVSLENQGVTTVDFEDLNPNQGLNSAILGNTQGSGDAGSVTINTPNLNLGEQSLVSTATSGTGGGGNINFNATNAVSLTNSSVSASLEAGAIVTNDTEVLGKINIDAPQISILNDSSVTSNVRRNAVGNGGEINLTTDSLTVDSSLVTTSTLGTGNAGSITINSTNDITLIGSLDGNGDLVGGEIRSEVGSNAVGDAGSVEITTNSLEATDSTISVSTTGEGNAGSLTINSDRVSLVNSSAESVVRDNAEGNAGGIEITSNSLTADDSILTTDTFGTGNAGSLILNIDDTILFENRSRAVSQVQNDAVGNAGNIEINTTTLDFQDASFASTSTAGIGNAGIVTINATEANFSGISTNGIPGGVFSTIRQGGVGNAQGITITTESLTVSDGAGIAVDTDGQGNGGTINITATGDIVLDSGDIESEVEVNGNGQAGDINVTAANVFTSNNSEFSSSTEGIGDAGDVNLTVSGTISLDDTTVSSSVDPGAVGGAGNVNLNAPQISVNNGTVVTSSVAGIGRAGNVNITATDTLTFDNSTATSSIQAGGEGTAGVVSINAPQITLQNNANLTSFTAGIGNAGEVSITAGENLRIEDTTISSDVQTGAEGDAGNVSLNAPSITLTNSFLSSDTSGEGDAGEVSLNGDNELTVENNSFVSSDVLSTGVGNAGNVTLNSSSITLANSTLSSDTLGEGDAGEVRLNATNEFTVENSQVSSDVFSDAQGDAGNISLNASQLTLTNSALSSNTLGEGNAGEIILNATNELTVENSQVSSDVLSSGVGNAGNVSLNSSSTILTNSALSSDTLGEGNAGEVILNATNELTVENSQVSSDVFSDAQGDAGNISLNAPQLTLTNSSLSSDTAGIGDAGEVNLAATTEITISNSNVFSNVSDTGVGQAGRVRIVAPNITVNEQSTLSSSTAGQGDAGLVTLDTTEQISFINSNIGSVVLEGGMGNAGSVRVNAPSITVSDNSLLSSATRGEGNAGEVSLDGSNQITINDSTVSSDVEARGIGNAGNVNVISPQITVTNSSLSSDTAGVGDAGEVDLAATTEITISGSDIFSNVSNTGMGQAGTVSVKAPDITINEESRLSSVTLGRGNAGEVSLEATNEIIVNNSTVASGVLAGAIGNAGNVNLNAPIIRTTNNAFLSSSSLGEGNAGLVNITATEQIFFTDSNIGSAILETGVGNAGSVSVNAPEITVETSTLSSETRREGNAGEVSITAAGEISLSNANITSEVLAGAVGDAGSITLEGNSLTINNSSRITSGSAGEGNAGEVSINAAGEITVNSADITSEVRAGGVGNAGSVNLEGNSLTISNSSRITSGSAGEGNAGDISIRGGESITVNDSGISSATETTAIGDGGSVEVTAPRILITNGTFLSSRSRGEGNAGSVNFNSQELTLSDRSQALVSNTAQGNAGNLEVNANTVILESEGQLRAETQSGGGGSITLNNLNTLTIEDNSLISASTEDGTAGSIIIDADASVFLGNDSRIQAEATDGGIAGDVEISADEVTLESGSRIAVNSPSGQAGNLTIGTIDLLLDQGTLSANTGGGDGGANIVLRTDNILRMRNESLISANASGEADGGNLVIQTQFIIAEPPTGSEGSDIIANAEFGNGGLVVIFNEGLFGIEFRPERTQFNDITASSQFGAAGIVDIASPNVDPAQSLGALPVDFGDATNLIANSCSAGNGDLAGEASSFIVTGRGGLPPTPEQPLLNDNVFADWVTLEESGESGIGNFSFSDPVSYSPIVEAKGWIISPTGKVILTAEANGNNSDNPWLSAYQCKVN